MGTGLKVGVVIMLILSLVFVGGALMVVSKDELQKKEIADLGSRLEETKDNLARTVEELKVTTELKNAAEERIAKLEPELEYTKRDLEEQKERVAQLSTKLDKEISMKNSLNRELTQANRTVDQLNSTISELRGSLRETNALLTRERDNFRQEVEVRKALEKRLKEKESELELARARLKALPLISQELQGEILGVTSQGVVSIEFRNLLTPKVERKLIVKRGNEVIDKLTLNQVARLLVVASVKGDNLSRIKEGDTVKVLYKEPEIDLGSEIIIEKGVR